MPEGEHFKFWNAERQGESLSAPVFASSVATRLGIVAIKSVRARIIEIAMMFGKRAMMRAPFLISVSSIM
jgi:hypothetical protein